MVGAAKVLAVIFGIIVLSITGVIADTEYCKESEGCIYLGDSSSRTTYRFKDFRIDCDVPGVDPTDITKIDQVYALALRVTPKIIDMLKNMKTEKSDFKEIEFTNKKANTTYSSFGSIDEKRWKMEGMYHDLISKSDEMNSQIEMALYEGNKIEDDECLLKIVKELAGYGKDAALAVAGTMIKIGVK